jgi:putative transcriptional regulator
MIKYYFKELIAQKEFEEKRKITFREVSEHTGISRNTLSRIANNKGSYSTKTEYVEKLCKYFGCSVEKFMIIIPDPETDSVPAHSSGLGCDVPETVSASPEINT